MFRTFNMGIGMIVAVAERDAEETLARFHQAGETGARRIGSIRSGHQTVVYTR
jgi:phosphoribosylformylglycinamidine cyclo-ligase